MMKAAAHAGLLALAAKVCYAGICRFAPRPRRHSSRAEAAGAAGLSYWNEYSKTLLISARRDAQQQSGMRLPLAAEGGSPCRSLRLFRAQ